MTTSLLHMTICGGHRRRASECADNFEQRRKGGSQFCRISITVSRCPLGSSMASKRRAILEGRIESKGGAAVALRQEAWQAWSCCNQSIQNLFHVGGPPVFGNLSKRSFPDDYKDWRLQPVDFYSRLKVERNATVQDIRRSYYFGFAKKDKADARHIMGSDLDDPEVEAVQAAGVMD